MTYRRTKGNPTDRLSEASLRLVIKALRVGAYDFRARFPEEAGPQEAEFLGAAIGRFTRGPFLVGRDTRRESRLFSKGLIKGLAQSGSSVQELGIIPTPVAGFEARRLRSVSLVASPSHNALGFVGLKAFTSYGRPWGSEWAEFRRALRNHDFVREVREGSLAVRPRRHRDHMGERELKKWYLKHLSQFGPSPVRVVVDSRGGATSGWASSVIRSNGGVVLELNPGQSATFHGLNPEPTLDSLGPLRNAVRRFSASFGVAFDGDGDRAVFVDERGVPVPPEAIALCLLDSPESGRRAIVASADMSPRLANKVKVHWSKVGGLNVCKKMELCRADIGTELSGHYYFKTEGFASDGILTAVAVAHVTCMVKQPLSHYVSELGEFNRLIVRIRGPDRRTTIQALHTLQSDHSIEPRRFCGGWIWKLNSGGSGYARVSQTEPTIRLVCEGSPQTLQSLVEDLKADPALTCLTKGSLTSRRFRGWSEADFRLAGDKILP